jgi:hypothetical protein
MSGASDASITAAKGRKKRPAQAPADGQHSREKNVRRCMEGIAVLEAVKHAVRQDAQACGWSDDPRVGTAEPAVLRGFQSGCRNVCDSRGGEDMEDDIHPGTRSQSLGGRVSRCPDGGLTPPLPRPSPLSFTGR